MKNLEIELAKSKLINIFKSNEYSLSDKILDNIINKLQTLEYYIITPDLEEINISLRIEKSDYFVQYNEKNFGNSFVIDYPPILINNEFYYVVPAICLLNNPKDIDSFLPTFYHEIMHFLSMGDWEYDKEKKIMKRTCGGLHETYLYQNGVPKRINDDRELELMKIDEFVNDFIAKYFYEKIEGKSYERFDQNRSKKMQLFIDNVILQQYGGNIEKFIGSYFSHELIFLKEFYCQGEDIDEQVI